jgi:DNA-binding IclR family transcriptional regulator
VGIPDDERPRGDVEPVPTARPAGSTRAVDRALALLEHVVATPIGPTLVETARAAELPVSTAARLLNSLESRGLIRRAKDGRYWTGPRMFAVAAAAMRGLPVYELAEPHLNQLCAETGESSYLVMPVDEGRAVYIRQVQSRSSIRHASWLGRTIESTGTATGAALSGDVHEGFAVNRGSIEPDAATAAAPVYSASGEIEAAISVIAPSFRLSDQRLIEVGRLVAARAGALSTELGAPAPSADPLVPSSGKAYRTTGR